MYTELRAYGLSPSHEAYDLSFSLERKFEKNRRGIENLGKNTRFQRLVSGDLELDSEFKRYGRILLTLESLFKGFFVNLSNNLYEIQLGKFSELLKALSPQQELTDRDYRLIRLARDAILCKDDIKKLDSNDRQLLEFVMKEDLNAEVSEELNELSNKLDEINDKLEKFEKMANPRPAPTISRPEPLPTRPSPVKKTIFQRVVDRIVGICALIFVICALIACALYDWYKGDKHKLFSQIH